MLINTIIKLFTGNGVLQIMKEDHMDDFLELFRNFELKKREVDPAKSETMILRIPVSLGGIVKRLKGKSISEKIDASSLRGSVSVIGDKMKIDMSVFVSLFKEPIKSILDHVEFLTGEHSMQGCKTIVMVGGFSESKLLQNKVKERFPGMKIIVPFEAGLAVLKGAVIFGHSPKAISERVCKKTYGANSTHKFSEKCSHKVGTRKLDKNSEMRCYDIFEIHVRSGQTVKLGEEQKEVLSHPVYEDQDRIEFVMYASDDPDVQLVTEPGCIRIGRLKVPIPDKSLGRDRQFGLTFLFGGTEIEVKVVDKSSGKDYKTCVDFLG